jgi:hypothetical protein
MRSDKGPMPLHLFEGGPFTSTCCTGCRGADRIMFIPSSHAQAVTQVSTRLSSLDDPNIKLNAGLLSHVLASPSCFHELTFTDAYSKDHVERTEQ